ncbi:unnamed protein product [Phaedon cochleariae]|uniref:Uncharacterized protein n=1 Tax=Phaedon cochleariae TaxID=80249 RepID=A0A9P0DWG0_PHACE|nr:unnamed protein product [Phaedon cochleariae]
MTLVLDVQCFKLEKNRFIVKELAGFDGIRICHYIFKAPFPFDHLSPDLQRQAHWLTENHHCIAWDAGFTPQHLFSKIITDLTNSYDIIYVKGLEKANYIRQFINKPVVEFDEQPTLRMSQPKCVNHSKTQCICALSNVFYLYENFIMSF